MTPSPVKLPDWWVRLKTLPKWAWGLGALLLVGLLALFASFSPTPADSTIPGADTLSTVGLGFDILLKLGVVVALIYVSLFLLRRWQSGKLGNSAKQLTVVETMHLSPRQALHLVQVDGRTLLLGATDQSISLITEIGQEDAERAAFADIIEQTGHNVERLTLRQAQGEPLNVQSPRS